MDFLSSVPIGTPPLVRTGTASGLVNIVRPTRRLQGAVGLDLITIGISRRTAAAQSKTRLLKVWPLLR